MDLEKDQGQKGILRVYLENKEPADVEICGVAGSCTERFICKKAVTKMEKGIDKTEIIVYNKVHPRAKGNGTSR